MARAVFTVGDIVRVEGIPGPHMVVMRVGKRSQHDECSDQAANCIWFDARVRVRYTIIEPGLLELVPEGERALAARRKGDATHIA